MDVHCPATGAARGNYSCLLDIIVLFNPILTEHVLQKSRLQEVTCFPEKTLVFTFQRMV